MREAPGALGAGHYARKQILCRDRLIAWSHRRRFIAGLRLAGDVRAQRVLDYGCGDGTFLSMLATSDAPPASAVGAELDGAVIDDCRRRLGPLGVRFVGIGDLDAPEHRHAYDLLVCMEVLEHVVDVRAMLRSFTEFLAPSGRLLVSVPVETGVALIVKQTVRRVAGWRGVGDYPGMSPYTWGEWLRSVFAGETQHVVRPVHVEGGQTSHDHKGFNWRVLRGAIAERFDIDAVVTSPFAALPPTLASQVWLTARRRHDGLDGRG